MRKALRKYLFVAAICLCTALTMAPVHAKAAGKVKNPAIVRLKPGKTYTKYDITGDKKKDKINTEKRKSISLGEEFFRRCR